MCLTKTINLVKISEFYLTSLEILSQITTLINKDTDMMTKMTLCMSHFIVSFLLFINNFIFSKGKKLMTSDWYFEKLAQNRFTGMTKAKPHFQEHDFVFSC